MLVEFQRKQLEFPSAQFGCLRDSTDALDDIDELRRRIAADGYLFIRGLIERDAVLDARRVVMEHLQQQDALVDGTPLMEGVMPRDGRSVGMKRVAYRPEVLRVLEGPELHSLYRRLYDEEPVTFSHKWLRAVGNEKFTGSHMDVVYMGRGSERVNTVWIPFGDIPIAQGRWPCARHPTAFRASPGCARRTAGATWIATASPVGSARIRRRSRDRFGGRWLTADVRAGDIVTFGLYLLHGSTNNTTNRFRISCDVRYQPASEPMDERWGGNSPV